MKIALIILVAILAVAFVTLVLMVAFEQYASARKRKIIKQLNALKHGDEIEINYPEYDSKAIFRSFFEETIYVVAFKNGVKYDVVLLPYSVFIKKI